MIFLNLLNSFRFQKLSNLIKIDVRTITTEEVLADLPININFPEGFNSLNCKVLLQCLGGDTSYPLQFKISPNNQTFRVFSSYKVWYQVLFVFIKI